MSIMLLAKTFLAKQIKDGKIKILGRTTNNSGLNGIVVNIDMVESDFVLQGNVFLSGKIAEDMLKLGGYNDKNTK